MQPPAPSPQLSRAAATTSPFKHTTPCLPCTLRLASQVHQTFAVSWTVLVLSGFFLLIFIISLVF